MGRLKDNFAIPLFYDGIAGKTLTKVYFCECLFIITKYLP